MKSLLIKMARDLGILMIPGVLWLVVTSMETRIAASLLITIYAAVEVIRTVCAKEIPAAQKWFPLITLAIIDGIGTYFLWSDIPKLYRYIKILLIFVAGWKVVCQGGLERRKDGRERREERMAELQRETAKTVVFPMIRDLAIVLAVGFCLLRRGTVRWEAAVTMLSDAYAVVESIRLLLNKGLPEKIKRYTIVGLYLIPAVVVNLFWRDAPDQYLIAMIIVIVLTGGVLRYQRAMEEATSGNVENTEIKEAAAERKERVEREETTAENEKPQS